MVKEAFSLEASAWKRDFSRLRFIGQSRGVGEVRLYQLPRGKRTGSFVDGPNDDPRD